MAYDAIIIGGGLAGLAAGAALTQKGKKVLILEQHITVGGLAAGFTRKGYYFDAGMSRVNRMSILMPLKKLRLFTTDDFAPHRSAANIEGHAFGCGSVEDYFRELSGIFVEEQDALMRLYEERMRKLESALSVMVGDAPGGLAGKLGMLAKMPALIRAATDKVDFNETMKRYLNPEGRAYRFLCERRDEVNYRGKMNAFMKTGKILTQMHNDYPVAGFQGLCDKLDSYITDRGGEISTGTKVSRILFEGSKCVGVEAMRGGKAETLLSGCVVSAIDLGKAFFSLIGEERIPGLWAERLRASELAATIPILYLGLNIPPETIRARLGGGVELMYYPKVRGFGDHLNDEQYYRSADMVIHSSSLINPGHAPAGKSSVQVYLQDAPRGWLGYWGVTDGKKTERYAEIKRMVIGQLLESLEAVISELEDRSVVEVCELGTPYTIERYTGSGFGCACGFTMDGDTMNPRKRGKYFDRLPGIGNLYFCGQQTCWPGAAGSALASGMHMADLIK